MATGGIDGHLRVWNFPALTKFCDIVAHEKEIDDIDFSPDNKFVMTIGKDSKCLVHGNLSYILVIIILFYTKS
jgi:prolactin regulatory element-binding protein